LKRIQKTDRDKAELFFADWEERVSLKIDSCKFCMFMKHGAASHGEGYSTASEVPGTHWACDTKSMYEDANGYKNLLVVSDMCSRVVYLRALKSVSGEETVTIMKELIRECGSPLLSSIRHDAGTQFVDARVQQLFAVHGITASVTVPGNKQQNGMAERAIQTCRIQLAAQQWESGNEIWSEEVGNTERALNNSIRSISGRSPADRHRAGKLENTTASATKEDEVWIEEEASWVLVLRTDKKKLDILPRIWDGPFKVVARTKQFVDIQDIAGNRSLIPISNTKRYMAEPMEDIETTALIMYNETNDGRPYYIVDRVTDHFPKQNVKLANLKLRVAYKGYEGSEWYFVKDNRDLLYTEEFLKYAEIHRDLYGFSQMR